jgi:molybdopterin-binding protein
VCGNRWYAPVCGNGSGEVRGQLVGGQQITSIITASSAREMHLKPGHTAAALIKATEVMILHV